MINKLPTSKKAANAIVLKINEIIDEVNKQRKDIDNILTVHPRLKQQIEGIEARTVGLVVCGPKKEKSAREKVDRLMDKWSRENEFLGQS